MKSFFVFALLFVLFSTSVFTQRPWHKYLEGEGITIKVPKLKSFKLNNGIPVYYIQHDLTPQFEMSIYIDGGSFEEADNQLGLTSLMASSLSLSGSKTYQRDRLAQILEGRAASFSASASLKRLNISFQCLSDFVDEGLSIVFDVLKNPAFTQSDLDLLKKRKIQSIQKRKENPGRLGYMASQLIRYQGTIRGRIATQKSVENIKQSDLETWYRKLFKSGRMSIAVVGDFDMGKLKRILNKNIGSLPKNDRGKNATALKKDSTSFKKNKKKLFLIEKNIPQTTVILTAKGLKHSSKDYYALKVFDFILGGSSFNSHLVQQIRVKKGWAYSVYSSYRSGKDIGSIFLFAQSANKNVPNLLRRFQEILSQPEIFITDEKIAKAKVAIANKFVFLYETPAQLLEQKLSIKWDGLPENYLNNFIENIKKVNRQDILRVAKKYYSPEEFGIVLVGPANVVSENDIKGLRKTKEGFKVPE